MASYNISSKSDLERLKKDLIIQVNQKNTMAKKIWQSQVQSVLKDEMNAAFDRGVSPVEGGGGQTGNQSRFVGYSPSYIKQMKTIYKTYSKKQRPVNLKLTGKMRNSLQITPSGEGVLVEFKDEKADFHNFLGAGKSHVIRAMLPLGGQNFSRVITSKITNLFIKIFKSI